MRSWHRETAIIIDYCDDLSQSRRLPPLSGGEWLLDLKKLPQTFKYGNTPEKEYEKYI